MICYRGLEMSDLTGDGQPELIVGCEGMLLVAVELDPSNLQTAAGHHVFPAPTKLDGMNGQTGLVQVPAEFGRHPSAFGNVHSASSG